MGTGLHTSWRHHSLTSEKRWKDCRRTEEGENKGVLVSRAKVRCLNEDLKHNNLCLIFVVLATLLIGNKTFVLPNLNVEIWERQIQNSDNATC